MKLDIFSYNVYTLYVSARVCVCVCVYIFVGLSRWFSGEQFTYRCRRCRRHRFNPWIRKTPWSISLQYWCQDNPMDRGAWRAAVHGVAKSQTWLGTHAWTCISRPLPIFSVKLPVFISSILSLLCVLWVLALYLLYECKYFLPFYLLSLVNDFFAIQKKLLNIFM